MKQLSSLVVFVIWTLKSVGSSEGLARPLGASRNRTGRDITCRDKLEYPHDGICCLTCPAGTFVKKACERASESSMCGPCDFGSYTEHENGLSRCLPCDTCHPDQDLVEQCSTTRNTRCQCKKGLYCRPDQACEVCRTCSRCRDDEEVAESCTPSSNTVCRKRKDDTSASTALAVSAVVIFLVIVLLAVVLYLKAPACGKRTGASCCPGLYMMEENAEVSQNCLDVTPKEPFLYQTQTVGAWTPVPVEGEDRGLGDSLPTTATSSQNSLCVWVQPNWPCPPRYSPPLTRPPPTSESGKVRRLVPVNGEESLKKSFDLFEEMDVNYHNRFFRLLGLNDNAIKNVESLLAVDRVYELLKVWLEKEGLGADINTLIQALLYLNQRLSAENIVARAIENGLYTYEDK